MFTFLDLGFFHSEINVTHSESIDGKVSAMQVHNVLCYIDFWKLTFASLGDTELLLNLLYLVTFWGVCSSKAFEVGTHSMPCSMSCQSLLSLTYLVFSSQYVPD